MAGSQGCLTSLQHLHRSLSFFVPPPSLLIQSSVARGFLMLFLLLREVTGFVGSWVELRCYASHAGCSIPGELHFDLPNKQLMVSVLQALEEHPAQIRVLVPRVTSCRFLGKSTPRAVCQSLGIADFLHCPNRVYHVADTAPHVAIRSNCTLVSGNIVRALLYLRPRVTTRCSQNSSGEGFPVNGNILFDPHELGLIRGLVEDDPTGYDVVLRWLLEVPCGCLSHRCQGLKAPTHTFWYICYMPTRSHPFFNPQLPITFHLLF